MNLLISINCRKTSGPYGGGNQFATNLERHLCAQGHTVCRDLRPGLDLILIVANNPHPITQTYGARELANHKQLFPNTVIVQRVNNCDEAHGRNLGINQNMLDFHQLVDHTVFVSSFSQTHFHARGINPASPQSIIMTGADETIFTPPTTPEQATKKLQLITHHWSDNFLKGFDLYQRLDELLTYPPYRDSASFTILGNIPLGLTFANTEVIPTEAGRDIAERLRNHNGYITGARYEAGGNHYIEAMQCGLPVLYLESGSAPEYCAPFGVGYTLANFSEKLLEFQDRLPALREVVRECPYAATRMTQAYETLFSELIRTRRAHPCPAPSFGTTVQVAARQCRAAAGRLRRRIGKFIGGS